MSLTIQTIEELEKRLEANRMPVIDLETHETTQPSGRMLVDIEECEELLSAARWALEAGYTDSLKEEESCPSPKNPCFCSCHPEKECLDCLCGRHKPNSSSQDGCKG